MPSSSSNLLYELWLRTARQFASERALFDAVSGRSWTFRELLQEAECSCGPSEPAAFPRGHSPEFILILLQAWRSGAMTCPLEANQPPPRFSSLPEGVAHLKLTSASTGAAKCVAFTAAQLAADPANIVSTMGLRPDWPNLACISLAHSYGFSNLILPLLLHGIPLVLVPAPLPEVLLQAARPFDSLTLPAVPALWKTWHSAGAIPPNIKLAISAGAPLPLELEHSVHASSGLKIHNFYGASECGGIAYDRTLKPRLDASLAGTAMDGVRLELSESETLIVRSEAVGQTYWPEPEGALAPGQFLTSDLATLANGQVYLRGRLSDRLNIAGRKISPEPIETALRSHPAVRECLVFSVPDPGSDRGETIVAAVNAAAEIPFTELATFLSSRIPAWQIPRKWWVTSELAVNQRGKISRAEWRQRYLEKLKRGELPVADSWAKCGSEGL